MSACASTLQRTCGVSQWRARVVIVITIQAFAISLLAAGRPQVPACVQPTEGSATLYMFNDSGPTLISGKQKVRDNGRTIVSLPRHTYQRLAIPPGRHELGVPNVKKPRVVLDVEAGKCYYVVVAYKPERSYAFPLAGPSTILEQITEDHARSLLATMTETQSGRDDKEAPDRWPNESGDGSSRQLLSNVLRAGASSATTLFRSPPELPRLLVRSPRQRRSPRTNAKRSTMHELPALLP